MKFLKRTWVEIDLNALANNVNEVRKAAGNKKIIAVVKANAYGHDDEIICTELANLGIQIFAVSNIWEGEDLRKILPNAEIIVFGCAEENCFESIIKNRLIPLVGSTDYAALLDSFAKQSNVNIKIHVKLDTGMSRVGIDGEDELCKILGYNNLEVLALCSHFAVSDSFNDDDRAYTEAQHKKLKSIAEKYSLPYHSSNSAGVLYHCDLAGDFVRTGLILYGYSPNPGSSIEFPFKPVMTLKSTVCQIKTIKKGADVSYGRTYTAPSDRLAAVIPVGYADGYSRALSNKGKVLIHGVLCPVMGRVCMDQIVVDVSDVPGINVGDTAEIYSDNSPKTKIEHIAEILGTIPYEITCGVGHRVPRVAVKDSKVVKVVRYE